MADMYVVQSKVKAANQQSGFRTSDEFMQQLNQTMQQMIKRAQERCKSEGMSTLKGRHC